MPAKPPTTPPAIAPVCEEALDEDEPDEGEGLLVELAVEEAGDVLIAPAAGAAVVLKYPRDRQLFDVPAWTVSSWVMPPAPGPV